MKTVLKRETKLIQVDKIKKMIKIFQKLINTSRHQKKKKVFLISVEYFPASLL